MLSHTIRPCRSLWRCTEGCCAQAQARRGVPETPAQGTSERALDRPAETPALPRGLEDPRIPLPPRPPTGSLPYPTGWIYRGVVRDVTSGVVGGGAGGGVGGGGPGRTWERCVHGRLCSMSDVVVNFECVDGGGGGGVCRV
jgi:hypothetical protein